MQDAAEKGKVDRIQPALQVYLGLDLFTRQRSVCFVEVVWNIKVSQYVHGPGLDVLQGGGDDAHMVGLDVLPPPLKQLPSTGVEPIQGPVWKVGRRGNADVPKKDSKGTQD